MRSEHNGLRLALRPPRREPEGERILSALPAGLVVLLGLCQTVCQWFPTVDISWWQLFLAAGAASGLLWLAELTGRGRWICAGGLVLLAIVSIALHSQVLPGLGSLGNDLLDRLTSCTGTIYLNFSTADPAMALWGAAVVLLGSIFLLHLTQITGKGLFFLPVVLAVYGGVLTGVYPIGAGEILLLFGTVLLAMGKGNRFGAIPSWLAPAAVAALVALILGLSLSQGEGLGESLERTIHHWRYDSSSNSMPEGQIKNLAAWNKSNTPALEITMTSPQKLYLRGEVYETYTGTAWEALDPQTRAEGEGLFYWLHKSHFYGQSQIGTATAFTLQPEAETLTVRNLSACRSHGYYPYALYGMETLEEDRIGDDRFPQAESLRYLTGSVPEWYAVQHSLASAQGRSNIAQYLACEEAYRAYVTEADLQITRESWSVLDRQLADDGTAKSLGQVRELIREYLEEALVYDENVRTPSGSGDFLQYTLERSGSGYSVHYATAATLMLRYFGIPARYVEGYFLSQEEAEGYAAGETIVLTENHAHAWAEYYLPGVGFVPFEVTPGYIDDEESRMGGSLTQDPESYTADRLKYAQIKQPEEVKEPQQDRRHFSVKPAYLLILLALLLLVLLVKILCNRRRLRRILEELAQAPNREAIAGQFGYARKLLLSCPGLALEEDNHARKLNQEALFSCHTMTDDQRRDMEHYSAQVLAACKEHWTVPQKLRYRLWDCLY